MTFVRKSFLTAGLALGAMTCAAVASAADFPQRTITLVVPFSPGGNVDATARIVAHSLSAILQQSVIVLNKPGAGGAIGAAYVAKADPSGYTLLMTVPDTLTIVPRMAQAPYKLDSFQAISTVATTSPLLVVKSDSRFKTIKDFLAAAHAHPGTISVAHDGPGSASQLALLQFAKAANCKLNMVPYQGSNPALIDLLGGQIDAAVDQMTSSLSHLKGGQMRALVVMSRNRDPLLPDVPTLHEAEVNFDVTTTLGIYAPAAVSHGVIDTLYTSLVKALADDELKSRLLVMGSIAQTSSPEAFHQQLLREDKRAQAMAAAGMLMSK